MLYVSAAAAVSVGREGFIALTGSSVASYHSVYVYSVRALTQTHALSRRLSNWKAFAMQPRTRPYSLYRINVYNFYIHTPTYIYRGVPINSPFAAMILLLFQRAARARLFTGTAERASELLQRVPRCTLNDRRKCVYALRWLRMSLLLSLPLSLSDMRRAAFPIHLLCLLFIGDVCMCAWGGCLCARGEGKCKVYGWFSLWIYRGCLRFMRLPAPPPSNVCAGIIRVRYDIYTYIRYYFDIIVGLISRFWFFEYILNCLCAADFQRQPEVADKARRIIPHHTHRASL